MADFSFVMRVNLILDLKKKKKEFDLIWWLENKNQSNILISKLESRKENFAKLEQYIGNSKRMKATFKFFMIMEGCENCCSSV